MTEWKVVLWLGLAWLVGASFYFYMPLASSTNPPMNWGYPRTWDGFVHAFSRGQYERANPTSSVLRFIQQMALYFKGLSSEFSAVMAFVGLLPLIVWKKIARREKAWLIGLGGIFFCLAVILMILLNPASGSTEPGSQSSLFHFLSCGGGLVRGLWGGLAGRSPERAISTVSHGGYLCRFGGLGVCPFR